MIPRPIGVIGGAGPLAAICLLEQIFNLSRTLYGCWEDADFPQVMLISFPFSDMLSENIYSVQLKVEDLGCVKAPKIDDRKRHCIGLILSRLRSSILGSFHASPNSQLSTGRSIDELKVKSELKNCLNILRSNGASFIAIACNTLHAFLDPKEDASEDLLQLPKITAEKISSSENPLILGTSTSLRQNLYQKHFPCTYPSAAVQIQLDQLINQILKGDDQSQKALEQMIQELPASTIVLACTELSLYADKLSAGKKNIIDPLREIAKKIVIQSFGV